MAKAGGVDAPADQGLPRVAVGQLAEHASDLHIPLHDDAGMQPEVCDALQVEVRMPAQALAKQRQPPGLAAQFVGTVDGQEGIEQWVRRARIAEQLFGHAAVDHGRRGAARHETLLLPFLVQALVAGQSPLGCLERGLQHQARLADGATSHPQVGAGCMQQQFDELAALGRFQMAGCGVAGDGFGQWHAVFSPCRTVF